MKTTSAFETLVVSGVAPGWARYARIVHVVAANGYPSVTTGSPHIIFGGPIIRKKIDGDTTVDASLFSQKLGLSNWDSLQPLWGFDSTDLAPFVIAPYNAPTASLSWVTGRSGARAIRVTTNGAGAIAQLDTLGIHAFAIAPLESVVVEGWMRASHNNTICSLGLGGFANRFTSEPEQAGGSGALTVNTGWEFFSAIVQVPAGTTRWACGRFRTEAVFGQTRWVEIDGLTIKRLARMPNAYAQSGATLELTSTATAWDSSQYILTMNFTRNPASMIMLNAALSLLTTSNAVADRLRTQFWLTKSVPGIGESSMCTWSEWGEGQSLYRSTGMSWFDIEVPAVPAVTYYLRGSKLHTIGTVQMGSRILQGLMLPRM